MELIPLKEINQRAADDPTAFIAECESAYDRRIKGAGDLIASNIKQKPMLLLSGPSSSGKTTTARRITEYLLEKGIGSHVVSMDDYFLDVNEDTPRNQNGEYDFESPFCVDSELLKDHIHRLSRGEEVMVPRYDFPNQRRADNGVPLRIGQNEVVVFEGIHALNVSVTGDVYDKALEIYTRVASQVTADDGSLFFAKSRVRLTRRIVRDRQFRGTDATATLDMWENVRAGEHKHIVPFSDLADIEIDSFLPYELGVLGGMALKAIEGVGEGCKGVRYAEELGLKLPMFETIDRALVPERSILKEFVG